MIVSAMECGVTITEVVVGFEHFLLVLECRFGLLFLVKNILKKTLKSGLMKKMYFFIHEIF